MGLQSAAFTSLLCLTASCGGDDTTGDGSTTESAGSTAGTGQVTSATPSGSSASAGTPDPTAGTGDAGSTDDAGSTGGQGSADGSTGAGDSSSGASQTTVMTSVGETTEGCAVEVEDTSAIGDPCPGGAAGTGCPTGYECIDPGGIVRSFTCQIPCTMDCECADSLGCGQIQGKAGVFNVCGGQ